VDFYSASLYYSMDIAISVLALVCDLARGGVGRPIYSTDVARRRMPACCARKGPRPLSTHRRPVPAALPAATAACCCSEAV